MIICSFECLMARASKEYSKNSNFEYEYEFVHPYILEFEYEASIFEQNEQSKKKTS